MRALFIFRHRTFHNAERHEIPGIFRFVTFLLP